MSLYKDYFIIMLKRYVVYVLLTVISIVLYIIGVLLFSSNSNIDVGGGISMMFLIYTILGILIDLFRRRNKEED